MDGAEDGVEVVEVESKERGGGGVARDLVVAAVLESHRGLESKEERCNRVDPCSERGLGIHMLCLLATVRLDCVV